MFGVKRQSPWAQFAIVTGNYWAFTLSDGALRMLVVLHFHQLGYGALQLGLLFLFYEFFGIVTNLLGGWLAARFGLNRTMNLGLVIQIAGLAMLLVPAEMLSIIWVMAAQALSGIAKDLNKMSAKSAIKSLADEASLFRWVALLTGSKNSLKGLGFFLGAALLAAFGFQGAVLVMVIALALVLLFSLLSLSDGLGKSRYKPKFKEIFSSSRNINVLSAARLFLFAARDVWFVIALPVFLSVSLGWSYHSIGAFLAAWVMVYGVVQTQAPRFIKPGRPRSRALNLALLLLLLCSLMVFGLEINAAIMWQKWVCIIGLVLFAIIFAANSAYHSYLVVDFARSDGASMDVGFYYMSNAAGRLLGTILSGYLYQVFGFSACLMAAVVLLAACSLVSVALPRRA